MLLDINAGVAFGLQPLHRLQRHHLHVALYARDIFEEGREGGEQLLLVFLELLIRLVNREVKIGSKRSIAPRFADLIVIAEGVVIPREHQYDDSRQHRENAQAEDRWRIFRVESGELKVERISHYRLFLKNSCMSSRHSVSSTPAVTVALGWNVRGA